jgi:hypothetical protein
MNASPPSTWGVFEREEPMQRNENNLVKYSFLLPRYASGSLKIPILKGNQYETSIQSGIAEGYSRQLESLIIICGESSSTSHHCTRN